MKEKLCTGFLPELSKEQLSTSQHKKAPSREPRSLSQE